MKEEKPEGSKKRGSEIPREQLKEVKIEKWWGMVR